MRSTSRTQSIIYCVMGVLAFLAAWEAIGAWRLVGFTWPSLSSVLVFLADPGRFDLFARALGASLSAALQGYAAGGAAGFAFALLAFLLPPLRKGADTTGAVIHSIPSIALGPLFIVLIGSATAPAALAALNVYFIVYVSTSSGLTQASQAHRDLFRVLGAGRRQSLLRLMLPAALPRIATGLRLAVPPAMIGVILGEWFGAPRGLGLLIVSAMQNFQIQLLWSSVLLASVTSAAAFLLFGLVERMLTERYQ